MSVAGIQSALQQMQSLQSQAAGQVANSKPVAANNAPQATGFADELKTSINRINELQQISAAKTEAFQMGDPRVSLNDVMVDSQKAGIAFEMGVQVRNRLVNAYKEIMNMNV